MDNNRWKTILCFDWPMDAQARLTKEAGKSRVWVVNMNQINFNHLTALQKKKAGCSRVVAFLPTGWTHASGSGSGGGGAKRYRDSNTVVVAGSGLHARHKDGHSIYSVPYSEHSSFNELIDFIKMFWYTPINISMYINYMLYVLYMLCIYGCLYDMYELHSYIHTYIHTCIQYIHTYFHTYIFTFIYKCMHIYTYTYTRTIYINIYTRICKFKTIYTRTYPRS